MTVTWTEAFSSFVPSSTGWNDYDIYTNKSVPKGAVALIAMCNAQNDAPNSVGVRTDGSSLSRSVNLHEAEDGGAVYATMFVKVDASTGLIDTYCSTLTSCTFYLLGYFNGVDFTEAFDKITTSTDRVFTDYDIYTNKSVPKGSVIQCMFINTFDGAYALMGVRTDGSSIVRYQSVHEAESAAPDTDDAETYSVCVKSSVSTGKIEICEDLDFGYVYYLGYFGSELDYTELNQALTISTADDWQDQDLTSYLDVDGRVCEVFCGHYINNLEGNCGCRMKGSELSRYLLCHEGEDGYNTGLTYVCKTDTDGILQTYADQTTSQRFYLKGYFKFSIVSTARSFGVIIG
jgi:hypothetical protein